MHSHRKRGLSRTELFNRSTNLTSSSSLLDSKTGLDSYEIKLGATYNEEEINIDEAKRIVRTLKHRLDPTPNAGVGVNYEYIRSNKIPVPKVKFGKATKKHSSDTLTRSSSSKSSDINDFRSPSAFSNYSIFSGRLKQDSINDDDHIWKSQNQSSISRNEDAVQKISKRIQSASTTVRGSTNRSVIRSDSGSSSKQNRPSSIARVLPQKTKEYLLDERRNLRSQILNSDTGFDSEGHSQSSIDSDQFVYKSFQKLLHDIEDDMNKSKVLVKSKKHDFKRHFKNTTFDSLDSTKQQIDRKIYDAAREQEARDRQEKELLSLLKAKIRRQRQRTSFKTQQQRNFLKRITSQEPRLLEQLAEVLDPTLDEELVSQGPTKRSHSSYSTNLNAYTSSSINLQRSPSITHRNHGSLISIRPVSSSSSVTRSSRLQSRLEREVARFDDNQSEFSKSSSKLHELDKFDRKLGHF